MRPLSELVPYAQNSRKHSDEQVQELAASMREWGFTNPILIDEDGGLIAGEGRTLGAGLLYEAGEPIRLPSGGELPLGMVPVIVARGWTDAQKRAYVIADNKLALNASWDDEKLKSELAILKEVGFDLGLTGFQMTEINLIFDGDAGEGDKPDDRERGKLLAKMRITIDEPRHVVALGDHYLLHERHHLFVGSVMLDWPKWHSSLSAGAIFCPYPSPFVPFGVMPAKHVLVMVQPDLYIAGHLLDRFEDAFGAEAIQKVVA